MGVLYRSSGRWHFWAARSCARHLKVVTFHNHIKVPRLSQAAILSSSHKRGYLPRFYRYPAWYPASTPGSALATPLSIVGAILPHSARECKLSLAHLTIYVTSGVWNGAWTWHRIRRYRPKNDSSLNVILKAKNSFCIANLSDVDMKWMQLYWATCRCHFLWNKAVWCTFSFGKIVFVGQKSEDMIVV